MLKKLKLSLSNFVDFKQTTNPAGDCLNEEWFFAMSIEGISQQETSDFFWNEIFWNGQVTKEFRNE